MSHLQYFNYPNFGVEKREQFGYSQAVRIGNRIECSGQGGWDPLTSIVPTSLPEEVEQAFSNVELNLEHAGGKGWEQVYSVRMYLKGMNEEMLGECVDALKRWCPGHQPISTVVGVTELGIPGMRVEVEVVADLGDAVGTQKE